LVCLEATEEVVTEAVRRNCGLVVSHHPLIFRGLKGLTGRDHVERTVLALVRNNIALYAIHTNLDNAADGVNGEIARRLGMVPEGALEPKPDQLRKLVVFVPKAHVEAVRKAMFDAGAGRIGNYDECSFNLEGTGTFRANEDADPFVGEKGKQHHEPEVRIEAIYEVPLERTIVTAMKAAHPYEAVAYDLYPLMNRHKLVGAGVVGLMADPMAPPAFLNHLKRVFGTGTIRHTILPGRPIKRVAVCGGSGSFLIGAAQAAGADAFITADLKYHQFFEGDGMLICDVGHYESEQFTMHLIHSRLKASFPTFAVHLTGSVTNPVHYS
jgi:dinuclear metal center YbgI/SA1388 family protein